DARHPGADERDDLAAEEKTVVARAERAKREGETARFGFSALAHGAILPFCRAAGAVQRRLIFRGAGDIVIGMKRGLHAGALVLAILAGSAARAQDDEAGSVEADAPGSAAEGVGLSTAAPQAAPAPDKEARAGSFSPPS